MDFGSYEEMILSTHQIHAQNNLFENVRCFLGAFNFGQRNVNDHQINVTIFEYALSVFFAPLENNNLHHPKPRIKNVC